LDYYLLNAFALNPEYFHEIKFISCLRN